MFRHLLVPLDGSLPAEAVLPLASTWAKHLQARVTLLHVLEDAPTTCCHGQPDVMDREAALVYLERLARSAVFEESAVSFHVHPVPEPEVARSVIWHAEELEADVILLSTQRGRWLRRVVGGGVTRRVLERANIPVLLVRPTPPEGPPPVTCRTIVVALEACQDDEPAIPIATELAQALSARVCFIHMVPTADTLAPPCPAALYLPLTMWEVLDREAEQAAASLEAAEAGCRARGIWARSDVLRGAPTRVLDEAVQTLRADLLVMVTRPVGPWGAFSAGSITPTLVDKPGPPLFLVRATRESPLPG